MLHFFSGLISKRLSRDVVIRLIAGIILAFYLNCLWNDTCRQEHTDFFNVISIGELFLVIFSIVMSIMEKDLLAMADDLIAIDDLLRTILSLAIDDFWSGVAFVINWYRI